ncbi:unnamed protein product [Adineta ricciae]|uniref:DYW domain-containing protein n=1 Tax=Adineta ricciae TaxID=249248 RepID=A0A815RGS8_ADIRI|nr:unnamed protein product [Adineta ricciae]
MKNENIQGDSTVFILLIKACANIRFLSLSQSIVKQIPPNFLADHWLQRSLIDMWGKCGLVDEAQRVFNRIAQPSIVAFSAMINAYGLNGKGKQAIELFHQKRKTFSMKFLMRNELKVSMPIDCFARSFQFDRAQHLIDEFEKDHSPCPHMYMTMLSSARNKKDAVLAQQLFDRIRLLFSDEKQILSSATVVLANTYGLSGNLARTSDLRTKMAESGLKKVPGRSSTIVNGEIVHFYANDRSHPLSEKLYHQLDQLKDELIQHGYQVDESWVSRPLVDGETNESVLWTHSERLAIAFQLIQNPKPSFIEIVKNLRICQDCHTAIKLIAQIHQCSIVIHDANRIHHFDLTGKCSCNDYF